MTSRIKHGVFETVQTGSHTRILLGSLCGDGSVTFLSIGRQGNEHSRQQRHRWFRNDRVATGCVLRPKARAPTAASLAARPMRCAVDATELTKRLPLAALPELLEETREHTNGMQKPQLLVGVRTSHMQQHTWPQPNKAGTLAALTQRRSTKAMPPMPQCRTPQSARRGDSLRHTPANATQWGRSRSAAAASPSRTPATPRAA